MHFKTDELLLLENITYIADLEPLKSVLSFDKVSVKDYLDSIDMDKIIDDEYYASLLTGYDFKNIIEAIKKNERLTSSIIYEPHIDNAYGAGGGLSVVFINEKMKEAVVAFRGTATKEWIDDFVGANQVDSLQQINSLEWYKAIYEKLHLEEYYVTVTGHSKGGNKAKYITILNVKKIKHRRNQIHLRKSLVKRLRKSKITACPLLFIIS